MLSKPMKAPGTPGPKWDRLVDDRLTQADFYDDLLFPRDGFRLDAGVEYPNERAMLHSMNTLHAALKKGSGEEWRVVPQEDGSRVVRLIKPETHTQACKGKTKFPPKLKELQTKFETGLPRHETCRESKSSGREIVVGRVQNVSDVNVRSKLTIQKKRLIGKVRKERRDEPTQSVSLSDLTAERQSREVTNKYEAEQRFLQSGHFEPFSPGDLAKLAAEKKRYLEQTELRGGRRVPAVEGDRECMGAKIIELFDSEGDGDDSDSSAPSFRTRIIRKAAPKDEEGQSDTAPPDRLFIKTEDGVTIDRIKRSDDADVANLDELSESDLLHVTEQNLVLDSLEDVVGIVDDFAFKNISSKNENIKADINGNLEPVEVGNREVSVKPLNVNTEMWTSMPSRNASKRTTLGILDRSQWHKDLRINNDHAMSRQLLRQSYDLKTQKEASARLSVPRHGPFAFKREVVKQTEQDPTGSEGRVHGSKPVPFSGSTSSGELYLKQNAESIAATATASCSTSTRSLRKRSSLVSEVKSDGQGDCISRSSKNRNPISLRSQFNLRTIKGLYDSSKVFARSEVGSLSKSSKSPFPYYAKQTGCGDVVSKGSNNSLGRSDKPDFDLRTSLELNCQPRPVALGGTGSRTKQKNTRRMAPMVETTVVSSSEVNRKKQTRNIDLENQQIMARLSEIQNRSRVTQRKISFRGTRREKLPLARIQNRAATK